MQEDIETTMHQDLLIRIQHDEEPMNPRDNSNPEKMYCFHKRYNLGDKHTYNADNFRGWGSFKEQLQTDFDIAYILPIYMYDHSGLALRTSSFEDPWDSGQVGFVFITKEDCQCLKDPEEFLRGSVSQYSQYLNGEVYAYTVEDDDGETLDSCCGYYDVEDCKEAAVAAAEACLAERRAKLEKNQLKFAFA